MMYSMFTICSSAAELLELIPYFYQIGLSATH